MEKNCWDIFAISGRFPADYEDSAPQLRHCWVIFSKTMINEIPWGCQRFLQPWVSWLKALKLQKKHVKINFLSFFHPVLSILIGFWLVGWLGWFVSSDFQKTMRWKANGYNISPHKKLSKYLKAFISFFHFLDFFSKISIRRYFGWLGQ